MILYYLFKVPWIPSDGIMWSLSPRKQARAGKLSVSVGPPLVQPNPELFQLQLPKGNFHHLQKNIISGYIQKQAGPFERIRLQQRCHEWGEVNGHIPFSPPPPNTRRKAEGSRRGDGVINLPNTDVGPKEGNRLRHVSCHTWKHKMRKKKSEKEKREKKRIGKNLQTQISPDTMRPCPLVILIHLRRS